MQNAENNFSDRLNFYHHRVLVSWWVKKFSKLFNKCIIFLISYRASHVFAVRNEYIRRHCRSHISRNGHSFSISLDVHGCTSYEYIEWLWGRNWDIRSDKWTMDVCLCIWGFHRAFNLRISLWSCGLQKFRLLHHHSSHHCSCNFHSLHRVCKSTPKNVQRTYRRW